MARHLLSLVELGTETLQGLVAHSAQIAAEGLNGARPLSGRVVGMLFPRPSTRTRTSFTVGAIKLGAETITYGPNDLQLSTGETAEDTGRVLAGYLDALVVRTNGDIAEMQALAAQSDLAVINAMSANEHPTQAIADLSTLLEAFGQLDGLHLLYLGEGNNTAAALALAVALTPGMRLTLFTPEGFGLPAVAMEQARRLAQRHGARIHQEHDLAKLPQGVEAVYTTRWQTMGEPKPVANWRERFEPFRVSPELMARVSKQSGTIFLHDLPAVRGADVDSEVLDGPQSLAFRQAQHKLFAAMAVLQWCLATHH